MKSLKNNLKLEKDILLGYLTDLEKFKDSIHIFEGKNFTVGTSYIIIRNLSNTYFFPKRSFSSLILDTICDLKYTKKLKKYVALQKKIKECYNDINFFERRLFNFSFERRKFSTRGCSRFVYDFILFSGLYNYSFKEVDRGNAKDLFIKYFSQGELLAKNLKLKEVYLKLPYRLKDAYTIKRSVLKFKEFLNNIGVNGKLEILDILLKKGKELEKEILGYHRFLLIKINKNWYVIDVFYNKNYATLDYNTKSIKVDNNKLFDKNTIKIQFISLEDWFKELFLLNIGRSINIQNPEFIIINRFQLRK